MALFAQPGNHAQTHTHICEKPHASLLRRAHLLVRKPRRIFEGLLDVFTGEVRVAVQNLVNGRAVRDLADDDRHRNPHPTDRGAATHDLRIERDTVEHRSRSEGQSAELADTIRGFQEIVAGKHDDVPEQAFYMKGTIEQVLEHSEQLKKVG